MTEPSTNALLAAGSYDDLRQLKKIQSFIPPGWIELMQYAVSGSGPNASYTGSGFSAKVCKNTASGEIVISHAGTEFQPLSAGMNMDLLEANGVLQ